MAAIVVAVTDASEVAEDDECVPVVGVGYNRFYHFVEAVSDFSGFSVSDALDDLSALGDLRLPDAHSQEFVVLADAAHIRAVEVVSRSVSATDTAIHHAPMSTASRSSYSFLTMYRRLTTRWTNYSPTASDEFGVSNLPLPDEGMVLLGNDGGAPHRIAPLFLGVVPRDLHPVIRGRELLLYHGEHVVSKDDGLFGILPRVLLSSDLPSLLFCRGVQVGVLALDGPLERIV